MLPVAATAPDLARVGLMGVGKRLRRPHGHVVVAAVAFEAPPRGNASPGHIVGMTIRTGDAVRGVPLFHLRRLRWLGPRGFHAFGYPGRGDPISTGTAQGRPAHTRSTRFGRRVR